MTEPTITCPSCQTEIRLTESLAAPLISAKQREMEQRMADKDAEVLRREQLVKSAQAAIAQQRQDLDAQVALQVTAQVSAKLLAERGKLVADEARKAREASALELEGKARELAEMRQVLAERNAKLTEAQKVQADLIKKQRELDDAQRELELTVQKRVQEGLGQVRVQAQREAEDALNLKVRERDQQIASMQQKIEELKQKSEQGSQQLQGEVQELALEQLLQARFPHDSIEPVAKGEFGGDTLQRVFSQSGQECGALLWESKRTKNWSDAWLVKLREDQRTAKAEVAILVSHALPKGVETFDVIDGVWVASPRAAIPVATVLRQMLLQVSTARLVNVGQQTKTDMIYQYLTGPRFKQRVEAIVEAFTTMQEDLDKERKVIMRQWAKREEQIERVMNATVGMYGDLQGIAGKSMQEIDGLSFVALENELGQG